ncbi:sulfatase [Maribacter sp. 2304DJ31-5]|uniref:sulfatase n=1 Tax=Maribacter sp. 2304DJ31-5 TaxID=3386273 RepID=UPI0039BC8004
MKNILVTLLVLAFLCSCKNEGPVKKTNGHTAPKNKNVVFILVDDLGWKDLGCYGSSFYETPNIDRLAEHSKVFTNAYTPNPVCSPTRAAILTGRYPSRIGITDWIPGDDPKNRSLLGPEDLHQLPLEETTIAESLKPYGYKTFFAGKWHLGNAGYFPENQGFDNNKGGHHMGQPPGGYYSPYKNPKLSDGPEGEYLTDRLTDESITFLRENKESPFLLYLAYYTVHTPIQASKRHLRKFQDKQKKIGDSLALTHREGKAFTVQNQYNAEYASMVYALDENVGRLFRELERLKLTDETLIIFTSDNGGLSTITGEWKAPTSVKPLRAGKGWAYEGGVRVPLIIKPPGETKAAKITAPVISMDLFPTILDEMDLPLQPRLHKDGSSLKPIMDGEVRTVHEALFWDYSHYHTSGWTPGQAVRKGNWKLIHFLEDDTFELYNLKNDISEQYDLATENIEKLQDLKKELEQFNRRLKTARPKINH